MIKFENVQIKYGDFVAIDNLNLDIQKGEFFTLLGPSGCGKTTTLRALVGFNQVSKGKIYINNIDITNTPIEQRGIGIVFQSYALFPTLNVFDNIAFGLKLRKESKANIYKKVKAIAKKVHISEDKLFNNVSDLSGGQQQRVAIARALVLNPTILCLDEPLSNLDAKLRVELRGELKRLQKELKITTIYVTHDQEEALTLSNRIAVFNNGKIEQVGTPQEIYEKSESSFVCEFIGDINKIKPEDTYKLHKNLKSDKTVYFRIEKLRSRSHGENELEFDAKVIDVEYTGMVTKVTYDINGIKVKNIEKNTKKMIPEVGDIVKRYLDIEDIMQFGDKYEQ